MALLHIFPLNVTVHLAESARLSDLEFELRDSDVIPAGCRAGACGACVIEVLNGFGCLSEPTERELKLLTFLGYDDGKFRLACQCKINGTATINTEI
jgi:ferredoxin